jgi:hypothetical protein
MLYNMGARWIVRHLWRSRWLSHPLKLDAPQHRHSDGELIASTIGGFFVFNKFDNITI